MFAHLKNQHLHGALNHCTNDPGTIGRASSHLGLPMTSPFEEDPCSTYTSCTGGSQCPGGTWGVRETKLIEHQLRALIGHRARDCHFGASKLEVLGLH